MFLLLNVDTSIGQTENDSVKQFHVLEQDRIKEDSEVRVQGLVGLLAASNSSNILEKHF